MHDYASEYRIALPGWIHEVLAKVPDAIPDKAERMRLVNALADRNWREGNGGPFAALVVERESGRIVSAGVNVVLASGVSSAHAEVVALGLAQTRLGVWDLGGAGVPELELMVNWRPCIQCYGATMWAGIRHLVLAGTGDIVEELTGFDEGPLASTWVEDFAARGITVEQDLLRDEAIAVFTAYGEAAASGDVTVYNARGFTD